MKFKSKIEMGAMLGVPVYEEHHRGKNWMAVINKNPKAPNGLDRTFVEKGKGEYFYIVSNVKIGDVVEFGADYISSGGRRRTNRWYGVVIQIDDNMIVIDEHETANEAIEAAGSFAAPSKREVLEQEKERILARLAEIEEELGQNKEG